MYISAFINLLLKTAMCEQSVVGNKSTNIVKEKDVIIMYIIICSTPRSAEGSLEVYRTGNFQLFI